MKATTTLSFLVCLVGLSLFGCQAAKPSETSPAPDRLAGTGPVELILTSAPGAWELLPHGFTLFEGSVQSQAGLSPGDPNALKLRVLNISTQQSVELNLDQLLQDAPHSHFDHRTGAFRFDFTADKRLGEGHLMLELVATDSADYTARWKQPVVAGPQFDNWSFAGEATKRQRYGVQILPLITVYGDFLRTAVESGRLDESVFPFADYDLALQQKLEETYIDLLIARPHTGNWIQIGQDLQAWIQAFNAEGGPHSQAEQVYRQGIADGLAGTTVAFGLLEYNRLSTLVGNAAITSTTAPDLFLWSDAFYLNTFGTATIEEDESSLIYHAKIRTNTGTIAPVGCCYADGHPFVEPEPDTWESNAPVFEMIVELKDTDADGFYDDLTYDGTLIHNGSSQPVDFEGVVAMPGVGLPHYNHLITPLGAFEYSDFWNY